MQSPRAVVLWLAALCLFGAFAGVGESLMWFSVGAFLAAVVAVARMRK